MSDESQQNSGFERSDTSASESSSDSSIEEVTGVSETVTGLNEKSETVTGRLALALIAASVILADITLYHAQGFSGPAVFFVGAAVILFWGIPQRRRTVVVSLLAVMLLTLCYRLTVNGFALQVVFGFWLLSGLALAFRGRTPFVLEALIFGFQTVPGGAEFFQKMNQRMKREVLDPMEDRPSSRLVEFAFPVIAAVVFGGIFVMANPDMVGWASGWMGDVFRRFGQFFARFSPVEIGFWVVVAWVTGGMLRPVAESLFTGTEGRDCGVGAQAESPLFHAYRNTLLTVIVLFLVYLNFETRAFLTRKPPEGFTYSSYAHEGAAWLTVALMVATLMLSLIFRGRTLNDPRLHRLKVLAMTWSALNLLLAVAVYNRMLIYIDFNGMTRMRVIGLLGITSVVAGFALVVLKIGRRHDFLWLIRRQLWVIGIATFVYLAIPVDKVIHRYNVSRILADEEAPIVQITEHPIDAEALPLLLPLCRSEDDRIRRGIAALLSRKFPGLQEAEARAERDGWTAYQKSRRDAIAALTNSRDDWDVFSEPSVRDDAWTRLRDHAYSTWW